MTITGFPNSESLEKAILYALSKKGGTATTDEIDEIAIVFLGVPQEVIDLKRSGNRSELKYRLAWARTKAKTKGLIIKTASKKWQLTSK